MVYFVDFQAEDDEDEEQWLRVAFSAIQPGAPVAVGDTLGKGSSGVVFACSYRDKAAAARDSRRACQRWILNASVG